MESQEFPQQELSDQPEQFTLQNGETVEATGEVEKFGYRAGDTVKIRDGDVPVSSVAAETEEHTIVGFAQEGVLVQHDGVQIELLGPEEAAERYQTVEKGDSLDTGEKIADTESDIEEMSGRDAKAFLEKLFPEPTDEQTPEKQSEWTWRASQDGRWIDMNTFADTSDVEVPVDARYSMAPPIGSKDTEVTVGIPKLKSMLHGKRVVSVVTPHNNWYLRVVGE